MHLAPLLYWILPNLVIHGGAIANAQMTAPYDSNSAALAIISQNLPAPTSTQAIITGSAVAQMIGNTSVETEGTATASFSGANASGISSSAPISTALYATINSTVIGNATNLKTTKNSGPTPTSSTNGFAVTRHVPLAAAGMVGLMGLLAAL